ncbi:hypothetical protein KEM55_000572, partial [Ascosphaera atra]
SGYWGRAWHCSLVDSTDRVSPTKRSMNIEKVIKELTENTAHRRKTLHRLHKDLVDAEYVDWHRGKQDEAGIVAECKKVIAYFQTHNELKAENDERNNQVILLAQAQKELNGNLDEFDDDDDNSDEEDIENIDEEEVVRETSRLESEEVSDSLDN